jgi:hypothetical protein
MGDIRKESPMPRKSRNTSSPTSHLRAKRSRTIPESFRLVTAAAVARGTTKIEVPMLVIYGEWLKAIGFPIGAAACLTTDGRGELALHRAGLAMPRRLYIRAAPR